MRDSLIRVGDVVINLDNVLAIDLNYEPDDGGAAQVVVEFALRGMDELGDGQNIAQPYLRFFEGREAEVLRRHLKEACPDLLTGH